MCSRSPHRKQKATPTFLVFSHRPWLLRRAEEIIVLKDGSVEARGQFEELRVFFAES